MSKKGMTETLIGDDGKSLFFLIISMACFWLILNIFYGNNLIGQLVNNIFNDEYTEEEKEEDRKKLEDKFNTPKGEATKKEIETATKPKKESTRKEQIKNNPNGAK